MKIIQKKLLNPLNLLKTQVFYIYKVVKVVIINKNKDLVFKIF